MAKPKNYRPDIDGLRALAVLAVIFFHFKLPGFAGGFIGVDIFFVISGYLIIRIIVDEINEGKFSLVNFWERRIRRIVPAMVVVMAVTAVAAYQIMLLPSDFSEFGKTLMSQSVFTANWWFMSSSEYFAAPANTIPLLHTWTLAVEEQFYLLFPLLTLLLFPLLKRSFRLALIILALLSFGYSYWLVNVNPTDEYGIYLLPHVWGSATNLSAAFYFILSRLWEFLVGGIVAVYALKFANKNMAEAASILGLGLLVYGIYTFSEVTAFPGLAALIPVLGTTLLIVSNTKNSTLIGNVLSSPLVVAVGLISYSLYLWHWPVLVLAKYQETTDSPVTTEILVLLLVLIFILSSLTYRFVEKPFRQKVYLPNQKHVYIAALVSLSGLFGAGYFISDNDGFIGRVTPKAELFARAMEDANPRKDECFTKSQFGIDKNENKPCLLGVQDESKVDFMLWGDSHANAVMIAFDEYGRETDQTGVFFGAPGCVPFMSTSTSITDKKQCHNENEKAVSYIEQNDSVEVFIVSEWIGEYKTQVPGEGLMLSGLLSSTFSQLPVDRKYVVFRRIPIFPESDFRELFWKAQKGTLKLQLKLPKARYNQMFTNPLNDEMDKGLSDYGNVITIDPTDTLCDETHCYFGTDEGLYYRDSSHLSGFGAKENILPLLLLHHEVSASSSNTYD